MLSPFINTDILSVSFTSITTDGSPLTSSDLLAPSTAGAVYQSGLIVAQYTSGPNIGQLVNYTALGTNGQNIPIGVIYDDQLATGEMGGDGHWATFIVQNQKGALYKSKLIGTVSGDVDAFIAALELRQVNDYNTGQILLYGF